MQRDDGPICRALCVDDNPTAVMVRAGILEHHGYEVEAITDERFVLEHLAKNPTDVLVIDYLMPEIRGDKLATMVRERYPKMPIVLISGAVDQPEDIGGADVFISKEAGHRKLIQVLDRISRIWRAPKSA